MAMSISPSTAAIYPKSNNEKNPPKIILSVRGSYSKGLNCVQCNLTSGPVFSWTAAANYVKLKVGTGRFSHKPMVLRKLSQKRTGTLRCATIEEIEGEKSLIEKNVKERMEKTIENVRASFNSIRTGRSNPAMLDKIEVEYYGTPVSLKSIAQISTPDSSSLVVNPYDKSRERGTAIPHLCICYFFYKNIAVGLTLFYFEAFTDFSGQSIYDDWYMLLFNVVLTSLPVISLGVFEHNVSSEVCLQFPALYQQGPRNLFFDWYRIFGWMGNGLYSSLVIFFVNIIIFYDQAFRSGGQTADIAVVGTTMFTCIIWAVNCQIALTMSHFTWIQHF